MSLLLETKSVGAAAAAVVVVAVGSVHGEKFRNSSKQK